MRFTWWPGTRASPRPWPKGAAWTPPEAGRRAGPRHTGEGQAAYPWPDPARRPGGPAHAGQRAADHDPADHQGHDCERVPSSTLTSTVSTLACPPGAIGTRPSTTGAANTPATRTGMVPARCTSTRSRGSGPCCALGSARIGASRRTSCRSISASSSSCTTHAVAAKLCLARSSPPWSYDPDQHPGSQQESTASSRCCQRLGHDATLLQCRKHGRRLAGAHRVKIAHEGGTSLKQFRSTSLILATASAARQTAQTPCSTRVDASEWQCPPPLLRRPAYVPSSCI